MSTSPSVMGGYLPLLHVQGNQLYFIFRVFVL